MIFFVFDAVFKGEISRTSLSKSVQARHLLCEVVGRALLRRGELVQSRILELDAIVVSHYEPRIIMQHKTFVERKHAMELWSKRSNMEHRTDGIIFQDADASYEMGTSRKLTSMKWKPECTIDLEGQNMRTSEGNHIRNLLDEFSIQVLESRISARDGEVVEYLLRRGDEADSITLFAMRSRPDKTYANGDNVVRSTLYDLIENVTEEFIANA